jgi:hypothetical protein
MCRFEGTRTVRLHKVINRVHQGTTYYRWVLSVPPRSVRELGWVDGQELSVLVRGSTLSIQPAARFRASGLGPRRQALSDSIERMERASRD